MIPQQAVNAVAKYNFEVSYHEIPWADLPDDIKAGWLEEAQAQCKAAAPYLRAQALEDAADELAAQRDATNHEPTPEDGESVRDHNDGRFLGKTVTIRLLRARAATERGEG